MSSKWQQFSKTLLGQWHYKLHCCPLCRHSMRVPVNLPILLPAHGLGNQWGLANSLYPSPNSVVKAAPGSWLQTDSAQAVESIWGISQGVEDLCYLHKFAIPIKLNKCIKKQVNLYCFKCLDWQHQFFSIFCVCLLAINECYFIFLELS